MNLCLNKKMKALVSVLAFATMTYAQAPAADANQPAAAPAAETSVAPAAAPQETAPAAEASAPETAPAEAPVAAETASEPVSETAAVPVAVRGADAAAEPAVVSPAPEATPAVEEPAVMVAPKAVRGADNGYAAEDRSRSTTNTVYYEKVYTGDDGVPVRTVYVAQREGRDTVTLDKLMGLVPMTFKVGASGSIGSYYMSTSEWDGDQYDGMNWRAGLKTIIPLSEYTMGIKLGVLFEQSVASESYYINGLPYSYKFKQKKIDVPVLFTFKAPTSRIFFDLGAQLSIPLYDKLKYTKTDVKGTKTTHRIDMIDEDYRNSVDWAFLFGFSVLVHKHISLDIGADLGLSNLYDGHVKYMDLDLSATSFNIGLSLYAF